MLLYRRDNSAFLRKTYGKILGMVLNQNTFDEIIDVIKDEINNLVKGNVCINDLAISKKYHCNNNSNLFYMELFSDNLRNNGKIVNNGDVLSFVIVDNHDSDLLGDKLLLVEDYDDMNSPNINYNYYINELLRHINELLQIPFPNDVTVSKRIAYNGDIEIVHKMVY